MDYEYLAGTVVTLLHYFFPLTTNQVNVTHVSGFLMSSVSGLPFSHIHTTAQSMSLCLWSYQDCLCHGQSAGSAITLSVYSSHL